MTTPLETFKAMAEKCHGKMKDVTDCRDSHQTMLAAGYALPAEYQLERMGHMAVRVEKHWHQMRDMWYHHDTTNDTTATLMNIAEYVTRIGAIVEELVYASRRYAASYRQPQLMASNLKTRAGDVNDGMSKNTRRRLGQTGEENEYVEVLHCNAITQRERGLAQGRERSPQKQATTKNETRTEENVEADPSRKIAPPIRGAMPQEDVVEQQQVALSENNRGIVDITAKQLWPLTDNKHVQQHCEVSCLQAVERYTRANPPGEKGVHIKKEKIERSEPTDKGIGKTFNSHGKIDNEDRPEHTAEFTTNHHTESNEDVEGQTDVTANSEDQSATTQNMNQGRRRDFKHLEHRTGSPNIGVAQTGDSGQPLDEASTDHHVHSEGWHRAWCKGSHVGEKGLPECKKVITTEEIPLYEMYKMDDHPKKIVCSLLMAIYHCRGNLTSFNKRYDDDGQSNGHERRRKLRQEFQEHQTEAKRWWQEYRADMVEKAARVDARLEACYMDALSTTMQATANLEKEMKQKIFADLKKLDDEPTPAPALPDKNETEVIVVGARQLREWVSKNRVRGTPNPSNHVELHIYPVLNVANKVVLTTMDTGERNVANELNRSLGRSESGQAIQSELRRAPLNNPRSGWVELLERLDIKQRFYVEYTSVKGTLRDGRIQRLLTVSLNPLVVFHGSGENNQKADNGAAKSAIEYLRVQLELKAEERLSAKAAGRGATISQHAKQKPPGEWQPSGPQKPTTAPEVVTLEVKDITEILKGSPQERTQKPKTAPEIVTLDVEDMPGPPTGGKEPTSSLSKATKRGREERAAIPTPPKQASKVKTKAELKQAIAHDSNRGSSDSDSESDSDSGGSGSDGSHVYYSGDEERAKCIYNPQRNWNCARTNPIGKGKRNPTTDAHGRPERFWVEQPGGKWPFTKLHKRQYEREPDLSESEAK